MESPFYYPLCDLIIEDGQLHRFCLGYVWIDDQAACITYRNTSASCQSLHKYRHILSHILIVLTEQKQLPTEVRRSGYWVSLCKLAFLDSFPIFFYVACWEWLIHWDSTLQLIWTYAHASNRSFATLDHHLGLGLEPDCKWSARLQGLIHRDHEEECLRENGPDNINFAGLSTAAQYVSPNPNCIWRPLDPDRELVVYAPWWMWLFKSSDYP
jgi:hypothetical protein